MDGVHPPSGRANEGGGVLRRDAVEHEVLPAARQGPHAERRGELPLRRRRVPVAGEALEDPVVGLRRQSRQDLHGLRGLDERLDRGPRSVETNRIGASLGGPDQPGRRSMASVATTTSERNGVARRLSAALFPHRRLRLGLTLGPTVLWMAIVYLASLALMLVTAFWRLNELSSQVERSFSLTNFQTLWNTSVYRTITFRTVGMAAAVTATDLALAFPIAYFAARIARPRTRSLLLLAVVMPLWSNYLVRVFAWRVITSGDGPIQSLLRVFGVHYSISASNWAVWLTFC